jgi:multidrug efflux pump
VALYAPPVQQYPNITPIQVTVQATTRRGREDARRLGRIADRTADYRRRQHALHDVDQPVDRAAHTHRLLLADTNPDIAQVQVQNRVNLAMPQLPSAVVQQGVSVRRSRRRS